jgi:hypothetical protein
VGINRKECYLFNVSITSIVYIKTYHWHLYSCLVSSHSTGSKMSVLAPPWVRYLCKEKMFWMWFMASHSVTLRKASCRDAFICFPFLDHFMGLLVHPSKNWHKRRSSTARWRRLQMSTKALSVYANKSKHFQMEKTGMGGRHPHFQLYFHTSSLLNPSIVTLERVTS